VAVHGLELVQWSLDDETEDEHFTRTGRMQSVTSPCYFDPNRFIGARGDSTPSVFGGESSMNEVVAC
jgi:hypothetical protein